MINVNFNADLGEGTNIEKVIMPFLSSCSIACGGHTGDADTMSEAIQIAVENNVKFLSWAYWNKVFDTSSDNLILSNKLDKLS